MTLAAMWRVDYRGARNEKFSEEAIPSSKKK